MVNTLEQEPDSTESTAIIQLKADGSQETVTDETGSLKEAGDVRAVAGNITDRRIQDLLTQKLAEGATEFGIDVSQVGASETVIAQLKKQQVKLREKGITMDILGLDSADLQRADVKEMQQTSGVKVFTQRDTGKAVSAEKETKLAA